MSGEKNSENVPPGCDWTMTPLLPAERQLLERMLQLYFYDFKDIGGVKLPHKIVCKFGDKTFATITARTYTLVKK